MTEKIYVVIGGCGEYSDRREWPVCAYRSKELADVHVLKAEARAEELKHWKGADGRKWNYSDDPNKPTNAFDPQMQQDYTGTDYTVVESELRTELPL